MFKERARPYLRPLMALIVALVPCAYFTFAAVQGDYGVFRQVQISGEADKLRVERDALLAELGGLKNLTLRMSDSYLDVELLDEQIRDVLGYVRADEVVIR